MNSNQDVPTGQGWLKNLKEFEVPSLARSLWQIINTTVPLTILFLVMSWQITNGVSYLWIFPLCIPAALFLVRSFIIFHDCTHGAFFSSKLANRICGFLFGTLMLTSYQNWRKTHSIHHATNSNLDKRGIGDIWTMTLEEYNDASKFKRLLYRIFRNPLFLFLIAPPFLFIVLQRIPSKTAGKGSAAYTWITNFVVLGIVLFVGFALGWSLLLGVYLPSFYIAAVIGLWLFFVQHQFDPAYWEHSDDWDPMKASLNGSSHYKLPMLMQWFSGNIGFHHIHHLKPRIPNYNLERAYKAIKELQLPNPLTFWKSLKSMSLHLWDEKNKCLLSFRQAAKALKLMPAR